MDENNRMYQGEDEISLRELIEVLLKEWKLIALISVGTLVLAGIFTFGFLKPSYESRALFSVSLTEEISTPYGTYEVPLKSLPEYTEVATGPAAIQETLRALDDEDLTAEGLKKRLKVETIKDTQAFRIIASGGSPEEAHQLATMHGESYLTSVEMLMKRMIIDHFYNAKLTQKTVETRELEVNLQALAETKALLEETPRGIPLESAMITRADEALLLGAGSGLDFRDLQGEKVLSEEINPGYVKLMDRITDLEVANNNLEASLQRIELDIETLTQEKQAIEHFRATQSTELFSPGLSESTRNLVTLVNRPAIEANKVSPRNALNLAIGLVLGMMLGVFVAFFKAYWQNTK